MNNIQSYFESKNIDYHVSGEKNVTRGWININCPFKDCDDPSWHCGINLKSNLFNCYKCGRKGSIDFLIAVLEKIDIENARQITQNFITPYRDISSGPNYQPGGDLTGRNKVLPPESTPVLPMIHKRYLLSRNFDPNLLIEKFKLQFCNNIGFYKFRIIAPIFMNNKIVAFQSRDVTGKAPVPYRNIPDHQAIIPVKQTFYNLNNITKTRILIVEGITDVWRFVDNTIATMSYNYTSEQIELLKKLELEKVFIMFDSEQKAIDRAKKLAGKICNFVNVEVLELKYGDPADLSLLEADLIKKEIGI